MFFLAEGAWPVFGFFGLDVLLLYWAFRLNYRHADAYEEVMVTPSKLMVRKVSHRGRAREWELNPLWVRLEKVVQEEFGIERLLLVSRGKRLAVANFLGAAREGKLRQGARRGAQRGQARGDKDGHFVTRLIRPIILRMAPAQRAALLGMRPRSQKSGGYRCRPA